MPQGNFIQEEIWTRMPTVCAFRRRGVPAEALRDFCEKIGITKFNSLTDMALLEHCIRENLNKTSQRRMAVMNPVKLVIDNYPAGLVEEMEVINNPEDPEAGSRKVPFSGELYIERDDFMEEPIKQFHRLAPGKEVRLRCAYFVTCTGVEKDENGELSVIHCTYDPETKGGNAPDGRKVKGTIHWVSAAHAVDAEARLYDRLFTIADTNAIPEDKDYKEFLNPESLKIVTAKLEPSLGTVEPGFKCQFERIGYFCADEKDHVPGSKPVFNRTVTLKDSWSKIAAK